MVLQTREMMKLEDPVVNLTATNFSKSTDGHVKLVGSVSPHRRYGSILFTGVSWCGYCSRTKPAYEEVARKYKNSSYPMYFLDADTAPEVVQSIGVSGFPTFVFVSPTGELTNDKLVGAMDSNGLTSAISQRIRSIELQSGGQ